MTFRTLLAAAAGLASSFLVAPAFAGDYTAVGPEFVLNSLLPATQKQPWLACDQQGNFVMVYSKDDIYARLFDKNGVPKGPDFIVNPTINYLLQDEPYVTMDPLTGDFVVGWSDRLGNDGFNMGCGARFFKADGTPYGPEFFVNTHWDQSQFEPHFSFSPTGRVMAVWTDAGTDGSAGVIGRIFTRSGQPVTGEFLVNAPSAKTQIDPSVSADGAGNFVVAFVDASGTTGEPRDVLCRRFDLNGNPLEAQFLVNTVSAGMQRDPNVCMAYDGTFAVAFVDESALDGDKFGVFMRVFAPDGTPKGPQFQVNQTTLGDQRDPQLSMDHVGNIVVCWEDVSTGSSDVMARRFDRDGNPLSNEFPLHASLTGNQSEPKVALSRSGQRMVSVWFDSDSDVHGRLFRLDYLTPSAPALPGTTVQLALDLPGVAGEPYLLPVSLATTPGIAIDDGRILPLFPDAVFTFSLTVPNSSLFTGLAGTVSPTGQALATFSVPVVAGISGLPISFAPLTLNPPGSLHVVHLMGDAVTLVVP